MTRFDRVKELLDLAVQGDSIGAHGAFWRNLNLEQFLQRRVQGRFLITLGNGAASNIILALRGQAPFGADIGTTGAIFRRMPAGMGPVPDDHIAFIEQWINDDCPEDIWPPEKEGPEPQGIMPAQQINAFFRALDNWSNFQRTQEVDDAINVFFEAALSWFSRARGQISEAVWTEIATTAKVRAATNLLAANQEGTVRQFFGETPDRAGLADAFERFGESSLPQDPLRLDDPHQKDGESMWFFWLAFAEVAKLSGRDEAFWNVLTRALLLGMFADGLFRGRFKIQGFSADAAGRANMRAHAEALQNTDLINEARRRFVESGLGA